MTRSGNSALIRALRSSVTSLTKSRGRIADLIKRESVRHEKKIQELMAIGDQLTARLAEDEAKIRELGG